MKTRTQTFFAALAFLAFSYLNPLLSTARAQGTQSFTFQGQLQDSGTNANGSYTMIFSLYDSISGGNQIGRPITNNTTLVNGLFTVDLYFGLNAFNGFSRWLDITVMSGSDSQPLSPRVQVLPTPYAQFATSAGFISSVTAAIVGPQLITNEWDVGPILTGSNPAFGFSLDGVNVMAISSAGTIYGDGGGLTNIHGLPQMQVFDTPGTNTFIVPTNVTQITVEVWGGGGGGASYSSTVGGGGGGGGYGKQSFAVTPGTNYTIVVGAGGVSDSPGQSSSFGPLVSATGGNPGQTNNLNPSYYGLGGLGGTSGAYLNITGGSGRAGYEGVPGDGGNAGSGGSGGLGITFDPSESGQIPGGGGGGGGVQTGSNPVGASGGHGRVVIYY